MEDESCEESPSSPIYKKNVETKAATHKLNEILSGAKLEDLPIDFLGTKTFSDIYLKETLLGAGAFAVVLKVIERSTAEEFAVKVLVPSS